MCKMVLFCKVFQETPWIFQVFMWEWQSYDSLTGILPGVFRRASPVFRIGTAGGYFRNFRTALSFSFV